MRRILAALLICTFFITLCYASTPKIERHRSTHWIIMVVTDGDGDKHAGGCTATAIGPHTLLTAEHCYFPGETLYIDSSIDDVKIGVSKAYHPAISDFTFDHEDHMLIDVPGAHFTTYVPLKNFRDPRQGEHFYFYGNPSGIQDQYREGYITGQINMKPEDVDVDASGTMYLATGPVVGGDSGSSLYALDGTLIGIVTFGVENGAFIGIFPIRFSASQIAASLV
jgi:hypothetical protein